MYPIRYCYLCLGQLHLRTARQVKTYLLLLAGPHTFGEHLPLLLIVHPEFRERAVVCQVYQLI